MSVIKDTNTIDNQINDEYMRALPNAKDKCKDHSDCDIYHACIYNFWSKR